MSALAWLASCLVCSVGWTVAKSTSILRVSSWVHEDSINYVHIAVDGLYNYRCSPIATSSLHITHADRWAGSLVIPG